MSNKKCYVIKIQEINLNGNYSALKEVSDSKYVTDRKDKIIDAVRRSITVGSSRYRLIDHRGKGIFKILRPIFMRLH